MAEPGTILEVAVPAPLMGLFDYLPPPGPVASLVVGQRLRVPFGRGQRIGVLLGTKAGSDLPPEQLRAATALLDADGPLLPADLVRLIQFASRYYQHPPGEVCATILPKALREGRGQATGEPRFRLTPAGLAADDARFARAPARARLLALLRAAGEGLAVEALDAGHPRWRAALKPLLALGLAEEVADDLRLPEVVVPRDQPPELTRDQAAAVAAIAAAEGFRCHLLDGVTGSGKTEVYLRAIQRVLAAGRQALVLVPEIALTPQLVERFRARLQVPVAELHSGLTDLDRLRAWCAAREGQAGVVIGTRSAIFTPLARPGILVVDEEHDASYKQQDGFRYSARDLAVWRARELGIPLVLGSATPSLETLANARAGRYAALALPARTGSAGPPRVELVDLRIHSARDGLSQPLLAAIRRHLDAGGQALVYLNRRGYAPTLLCPGCGRVEECRRCDARMVLHHRRGRLVCHHCGAERPPPATCEACGSELLPVGQGTERLEQALAAAFPDESVVRIDRDTIRRRGELERQLGRVRRAEARILLGTQMLAKGHDFPRVTCVGIVDADQGLFGTDFRSAERLAQAFIQVAGRAGRADRPGEVFLQTAFPDHPLLGTLIREGYGAFAAQALAERKAAGWPPYACLALLRVEAEHRPAVHALLDEAARLAREAAAGTVRVLGPAPSPMERRAGRFRGQVLVQATERRDLMALLPGWRLAIAELPEARRARWHLDVDPQELF